MNDDDNWVNSAINDIDMVVQVILTLRQPSPFPPPKTWTIRQRRSRPPPPPPAVKKSSSTRASPTTPLSWSGAEESDVTRSKVILANETTPTKRARKKKTLAELKEDETTLLKERKQLKRQIANLQATCLKQRRENESLKKMKNDMRSQGLAVCDGTEEQKNESFVLPDLNIPAGESY